MRNLTVWQPDHSSGTSSDNPEEHFVRTIERDGAVIVERSWPRPSNHHTIGVGVGHDDAQFAETGRSYAAYLENDNESGPWWENLDAVFGTRKYYDPEEIRTRG